MAPKDKALFKQTEIGLIPEDWEITELDKLTSLITDGKHGDCQNQKDSGYYFLSAKDVIDGRLNYSDARQITKQDFIDTHKRTNLEAVDVLLSNSGTIGRLAIAEGTEITKRTTFQKSVAIIKPNKFLLDSYFLYYYFLANLRRVQETAGGTTQQNLLLKDLRAFKIARPSLPIQQEQVTPLRLIDTKIELNRKMNATLEAIGQTVFRRWFVDFEFPNEEGKPYKSSGGEILLDSEFGKVPRGWEFGKISDVISLLETGFRPDGGIQEVEDGIPSIGAESIDGIGIFDFSRTKFVSKEFYNNMKRGKVVNYDVLLYKDGGRPGEFKPRITMVGNGFPFYDCCINEHVYRIRANERTSQAFLYLWLSTKRMKEEMYNRATGVAIPGINSTEVNNLPIIIPEKNVLLVFDKIVMPLFDKIFINCLESKMLMQIRDLLLPKLLSGKIRVPVSEENNEEQLCPK